MSQLKSLGGFLPLSVSRTHPPPPLLLPFPHTPDATIACAVLCCVLSRSVVSNSCSPMDCSPPGFSVHGDCHALFQGIFSTQGSNPGLPHYRWILYHLNHQGSIISSELIKLSSYPNKLQPMREVGGGQKSCSEVGPSSFSAEKDLIT